MRTKAHNDKADNFSAPIATSCKHYKSTRHKRSARHGRAR